MCRTVLKRLVRALMIGMGCSFGYERAAHAALGGSQGRGERPRFTGVAPPSPATPVLTPVGGTRRRLATTGADASFSELSLPERLSGSAFGATFVALTRT